MSDPTKCPKCGSRPLLESLPRLYCSECDWNEGDELTRLRAREAVLVKALTVARKELTLYMETEGFDEAQDDSGLLDYLKSVLANTKKVPSQEPASLRAALGFAEPALEYLVERNGLHETDDCHAEASDCGLRDCHECGCVLIKLRLTRKALATISEER